MRTCLVLFLFFSTINAIVPVTPRCQENEQLRSCPGCEPTCEDPTPICPRICKPGRECQCKKGFVRDENSACIIPSECPDAEKSGCPENEFSMMCGVMCEATCDNPTPTCPLGCKPPGCYCIRKDHVRGPDGKCMHKSLCKKAKREIDLAELACPSMNCPTGLKCRVFEVECIRPPCPAFAQCVSIKKRQVPQFRTPFCERARCANGPCLPIGIHCRTLTDCEYIGRCVDRKVNPDDVYVCQDSVCPKGTTCKPEVDNCSEPPCLKVPICIPYVDKS